MTPRRPSTLLLYVFTIVAFALATSCGDDNGTTTPTPTPDPGTVSGTATDGGGQGVSGLSVSLVSGGTTQSTTTSNSAGAFQFTGVTAGSYTLALTAPAGFRLASGQANPVPITVTAGGTTSVTINLVADVPTTGGVEGTVRFQGQGIQGATVALEGPGGPLGQVTTDGDGDYKFEDLPPGSYTLTLTPPNAFVLAAGEEATKTVAVAAGPNVDVDYDLELAAASPVVVVQLTSNPTAFVGPSGGSSETIARGTTIRWVNTDATLHTVTPEGHDAWDRTETRAAGVVLEVLFVNPGTFPYYCEPHQAQGMTGTIIVQQ